MEDYPELSTRRLLLSNILESDIDSIVAYASNINVSKTTLNMPYPYHREDAEYWINMAEEGYKKGDHYIFAIRLSDSKKFIGGIGLNIDERFDRAALGYWMGEPFWGKGYISEAVSAVLRFGFKELTLNKIYGTHTIDNPASGKVMIKNGMIKEGELKEHTKKGRIYHSLIQYRLTRKEWLDIQT